MATAASSRRTLATPVHGADDLERVAHELKNPLFAITGVVELLLRQAEPGSQAYEQLKLIERAGVQMTDIVRSLLDGREVHS
jgi:signal transduction histidine kinase